MKNIKTIYEQYAILIKKYIFRITQDMDLAEDIMQETFVVAITQINKFRGDCDIFVWLCSIAKKILYKKTKKDNWSSFITIDDLNLSDDKLLEEQLITNDNKLKLFETLQKLDSYTREVMYLRLTGELTFKEIGQILHKSESWAKVTFFRGKEKIKEDIIK